MNNAALKTSNQIGDALEVARTLLAKDPPVAIGQARKIIELSQQ